VVQDAEGVVLAVACWNRPLLRESDIAECVAMLKGWEFVNDILFLNISAETDSSNVFKVLLKTQPQRTYLATIAEDFYYLYFVYVCQAAHYLAKWDDMG